MPEKASVDSCGPVDTMLVVSRVEGVDYPKCWREAAAGEGLILGRADNTLRNPTVTSLSLKDL